jgi:hypothetical protein
LERWVAGCQEYLLYCYGVVLCSFCNQGTTT